LLDDMLCRETNLHFLGISISFWSMDVLYFDNEEHFHI
jgi:hypothetical protein